MSNFKLKITNDKTTANILPGNCQLGKFIYRLAGVFARQEEQAGRAKPVQFVS
jgi:hypothetical protein